MSSDRAGAGDGAPYVVFYDGLCALCDASIRFLLRIDRKGRLRFCSLQSARGRDFWQRAQAQGRLPHRSPSAGGRPDAFSTLLLSRGNRLYSESEALLEIAAVLPWPWAWLQGLRILPPVFRDALYRFVARHRYQIWGRRRECRMPSPEDQARFLDFGERR